MHIQAEGEHALGLDADVQVGRLAGDGEVAGEAAAHERVGGAVSVSSDSSSGAQTKRTRAGSCSARSLIAHIIAASPPFMS